MSDLKLYSPSHKYYLKYKDDPEYKKRKAINDHNYYLRHKEKCLSKRKLYLSKNQDKVTKYRNKCRNEVIQLLGSKCSNPFNIDHTPFENETDYIHCLQIDHINGKGKREINSFSYNRAYYKFVLAQLKAGSKDYQLLCANCNWLKRYKNKEQ